MHRTAGDDRFVTLRDGRSGLYCAAMSTPRFFCAELAPGVITLEAAEARHATQSLRLRSGDEVLLFDGRGRLAHGILRRDDATGTGRSAGHGAKREGRAVCVTVERVLCEPPPERTLTLVVAGCKGPRLTWMIEKLTELGTTRVVIGEFERSVVHVAPTHASRFRRTALEAAKQSQRAWLPEIRCGVRLAEAVETKSKGALLVAHPAPDAPAFASQLHAPTLVEAHLTAVVGPEGGLTDAEVALLREKGGRLVRLAPGILRVETAAISLAANWAAHQPL